MSNLKSIFAAGVISLAVASCNILTQPANAGLFLSPMYLKMELKQGQSKGVIQVGNTSPKPIRVRLYLTGFTYSKNGVFQRRDSLNKKGQTRSDDLTPYLRYSPREMVIPGNSSRRIRLIGLLPPSFPDGEYRTAIFAETLQEKTNSQGRKVGLNISIGSALYVTKGEVAPHISVAEASFNSENKSLNLLVANEGTATAKGEIDWVLKQGKEVVGSGKSGGSFLPDSQTNLELNRQRNKELSLEPGVYQLEGKIIWERSDEQEVFDFDFEIEL
ncbi:MAG: P pilus assembly protein, chaperone PapD [Cyanobacteria bacterium P01_A01_bin.83]